MRRRNFLKTVAGASAAGFSPSAFGGTPALQPPADGSLKKGVSIWCFPAKTPVREAMKKAKETGFAGLELAFSEKGEIGFESTPEQMRQLLAEARSAGIQISGLATADLWNYPLSSNEGKEVERGKAIIRKMLELAEALSVDAILVVPALVGRAAGPQMVVRYETAWQRSTDAIGELIPVAEKHQVCLAIENVWNRFLLSPLEMRSYVDQFRSPWVQAYLDIGNLLRFGYAQDWVLTLGPRIKRVHVKDFNMSKDTFVNLLEGDLDWPAAVAALREVGFRGFLTAELSAHRSAPDLLLWNTSKAMDYILAM
jgi:L-ribulose-5-phosphate 3-epimerase